MADYKRMYSLLFNIITDVIKELQVIQEMAEDLYINGEESVFYLFGDEKQIIAENKETIDK